MKKIIKYNYEILFVMIIFLQIGGLIGGFLQPIRFLSVLIFIYLLNKIPKRIFLEYKFFFIFFISIIIYSLIFSLFPLFNFYTDDSIKSFLYNVINFIICLNLIILSYKIKDVDRLIFIGWVLFLLVALPLSLYEIFFNHHFITVIEEDALVGGTNNLKIYSSLTYGNYNQYNMVLMCSLPFLFSQYLKTNKTYILLLLSLISFIFITNGSRSSLVALSICFLLYLLLNRSFKSLVASLLGLVVFIINIDKFEFAINRFNELGFNDNSRSNLYNIAFQVLLDSNFIGIGPGNFKNYVLQNKLSEIVAPHNFLLEVLSEYGIVIFSLLLLYITKIFKTTRIVNLNYTLLFAIIIFIPIIVINSLYVQGVYIWIFLTLLAITKKSNDKLLNKKIL